jgi:hypothetical protein
MEEGVIDIQLVHMPGGQRILIICGGRTLQTRRYFSLVAYAPILLYVDGLRAPCHPVFLTEAVLAPREHVPRPPCEAEGQHLVLNRA